MPSGNYIDNLTTVTVCNLSKQPLRSIIKDKRVIAGLQAQMSALPLNIKMSQTDSEG